MARRENLKLGVKITVDAEYFSEGSLLRGDRRAGAESIVVNVSVDGDQPPERIARVVREAGAGCFTIGALCNASPVSVAANLNGSPLDLGDQVTTKAGGEP